LLFDEGSKHSRSGMSGELWPAFSGRVRYIRSTFEDAEGYTAVGATLSANR
jgi:glucose-6-phosphate 1-dehydrogenase